MTAATAWRLARPRPGRGAIAAAVAITGALVLYVLHLLRATIEWNVNLSSYIEQRDLRLGVITAALLLSVPVLALALQALRMGSAERDRRTAALRLAGLTPLELRIVAGVEAGRAALVGGAWAGPAYIGLWFVAGVLPPDGARVADSPDVVDAFTWLALVPVLAVAGGLAGAFVQTRRPERARPGRASFAGLAVGSAIIAASLMVYAANGGIGLLFTAVPGLLVFAFACGPWLVLGSARLLERRPSAERLLAARRLRADPHSAGRVAGVLIVCGVAFSVEALLIYQALADPEIVDTDNFYAIGYSLAAAVMLAGCAVTVVTLLLGTADGLLAARRPLAALNVFGVDERTLLRVLTRQLLATAVPAVVLGALFGGATLIALISAVNPAAFPAAGFALLIGGAAALIVGTVLALVTVLAVRLLRPLVRAAIDPQNLRAA
ncbi:hypothetical protein OJ998_33965 [Solirubrobacter taibaiensis]|nr:hypothetical protein [Solirubrobacter taibaiensis]